MDGRIAQGSGGLFKGLGGLEIAAGSGGSGGLLEGPGSCALLRVWRIAQGSAGAVNCVSVH